MISIFKLFEINHPRAMSRAIQNMKKHPKLNGSIQAKTAVSKLARVSGDQPLKTYVTMNNLRNLRGVKWTKDVRAIDVIRL